MDKTGHTNDTDYLEGQGFFTEGAGTNSTQINVFESENNLDLTNQATSWDATPARGPRDLNNPRDPRGIGRMAAQGVAPAEPEYPVAPENSGIYSSATEVAPNFGEIVDLEMPPTGTDVIPQPDLSQLSLTGQPGDLTNSANSANPTDAIDFTTFRVEKDRISPKTLEDTIKFVNKYEKGKIDPAELNDDTWTAKVEYLKNSYGRELGAA